MSRIEDAARSPYTGQGHLKTLRSVQLRNTSRGVSGKTSDALQKRRLANDTRRCLISAIGNVDNRRKTVLLSEQKERSLRRKDSQDARRQEPFYS